MASLRKIDTRKQSIKLNDSRLKMNVPMVTNPAKRPHLPLPVNEWIQTNQLLWCVKLISVRAKIF